MTTYDYAIVGAGAAGCILAARLSEDADTRVLVLESGVRRVSPLLSIPAGEILLLGNQRYDWLYETEPEPTLNGRRLRIPRGRLLGGSNAINGMIFVRGQPADFDDWVRLGARGWSWADVLPYFRKLEDWEGGSNATRGAGGPIRIELPRQHERLCDIFLEAANEIGFNHNADYNSGDLEGFGYYQCTQRAGRRASVVNGYLDGACRRQNLSVKTNATVSALRFENRRCVGLTYDFGGVAHNVAVTREVILSAGVVGSPHLLELSGVGKPSVLREAGIPVFHALSGVGENLQDHFAVRLRWRIKKRVTFNERMRGLALAGEVARYLFWRRGVLSLPIAIGFGFIRSQPDEPVPDLQFHFAPASYGTGSTRRLDARPGMTIGVYPMRPDSRGSIHLVSADPKLPPAIRPHFLSGEGDQRRLIAGMRIARRIVAAHAFDSYRSEELAPGSGITTAEALIAYAREYGDTSFHPTGTCRMGNDRDAVVDCRLRVRGLDGVRVVDASIMPTMVSGNTQAATMMVAERAAALIREDVRLARQSVVRATSPPREVHADASA